MTTPASAPWMVSLHGGHSSAYCDHADSKLKEMLDAAVERGLRVYGITEHAPRTDKRFLFPEEVAMGWDVRRIGQMFEMYAEETRKRVAEYADRICLLRGFEIEVVPNKRYVEMMQKLRERHAFDYIVGSVHFVDEQLFDYNVESLRRMAQKLGGLEKLAVRYYRTLAEMVEALRPEVVGHLDVVRKYAAPLGDVDTPPIREAAMEALEAVRASGGIIDVNTGAYRRGQDVPYPAPWLVEAAREMGLPFCFGDDSHSVADVGAGIEMARAYLLDLKVETITCLVRRGDTLDREVVPLH